MTNDRNDARNAGADSSAPDPIARREQHIIDLARIVAAESPHDEPGSPESAALLAVATKNARIDGNHQKSSRILTCDEHGQYDEGDAQWNVILDGEWAGACRHCLPAAIELGEIVLDRRSAHETLAYMLSGAVGRDEYRSYFLTEAEALEAQVERDRMAARIRALGVESDIPF